MLERVSQFGRSAGTAVTETFMDAFAPSRKPSKDGTASYQILGKKPKDGQPQQPTITADTAAIYLGKIMKHDEIIEVFRESFGILPKGSTGTYSEPILTATLRYAYSCTPKGETVTVIVCRTPSELFNGHGETDDSLSLGEEMRLIGSIARGRFNSETFRTTRVCTVESLPENQALFGTLKTCFDPEKGAVDVDKAYSTEAPIQLTRESSALEIAQFLYQAAQKNPKLLDQFAKLRPGELKKLPIDHSSTYYGLNEIAFRLRALLSGQKTQMGVSRQQVYDDFIIRVAKGLQGDTNLRKNFPELHPLLALFGKDTPFETVHIKSQTFELQKKKRSLARIRLLIAGCVINTLTLTGMYGYARYVKGIDPDAKPIPADYTPVIGDEDGAISYEPPPSPEQTP